MSGRTVLVTGAGGGIGAACAAELARRGHAVALGARRQDQTAALAESIRAAGGRALAVALDVTDYAGARAAAQDAAARLGPLDALVNNAAVVGPIADLADPEPAHWDRCIRTNLIGAWNMAAAVLPAMAAAGAGTVVNVSSGAAAGPVAGLGAYCASKAALTMLTRAINLEYGARGVRAYGLRPGVVATRMQDAIRASKLNPLAHIAAQDMLPPERPAQAIAWLIEARPEQWCGEREPDVREPEFSAQAFAPASGTDPSSRASVARRRRRG